MFEMPGIELPEILNRYRWKRHFNALRNDIIEGYVPEPHRITIELTLRCNLSCQMCFRDRDPKKELTFQEVKGIIDGLTPGIRQVHLIGGEVFLRKDLFDILELLDERGYRIRIHSNGTLLTEEIFQRLRGIENLRGIGFSIDGPPELHNRIRGAKDAYERTIEAIKRAREFLEVSINTVLLKENFSDIERVFTELRDLGIKEYRIEPEMFATPDEMKGSDIAPLAVNEREGGYSFSAEELRGLKERLDDLASASGVHVVLAPRVAELDAPAFIKGDIREHKRLFCKHIMVPRIDSEGYLVHCHIIRKRFGSLLEKSLEELWAGKELMKFRKELLEDNLYPVCKRCCRLRSI